MGRIKFLTAIPMLMTLIACGASKDSVEIRVNTGIPVRAPAPVNLSQNLMSLMSVTLGTDCYQDQIYLVLHDPNSDQFIASKKVKLRTNLTNSISFNGSAPAMQEADINTAINHLVNNSFFDEPLTLLVPKNQPIEIGLIGTFFKPQDSVGGPDGICDQTNASGTFGLNSTSLIGHALVDANAINSGNINLKIDVMHTNPVFEYSTLSSPKHKDWVKLDTKFFSAGKTASISVGANHVCALISGGVQCWGDNTSSQVGSNTPNSITTPYSALAAASSVQSISSGGAHTCMVIKTPVGALTAKCWGSNSSGQLGVPSPSTSNTPMQVGGGLNAGVEAIAAGSSHSCAIQGGTVQCWGKNSDGQLGAPTPAPSTSTTPIGVATLDPPSAGVTIQSLALGDAHSCAVINGGVKCWGANSNGQLGNGGTTPSATPVPVFADDSGVTQISSGLYHNCVLADGIVKCWGDNLFGQIGDGTVIDRSSPVSVQGLTTTVKFIAAGGNHTCALMMNKEVWCWGANSSGQLGNGSSGSGANSSPIKVNGINGVPLSISANGNTTCVLTNIGAQCWGANQYGQLAIGNTIPTQISSPTNVTGFTIPVNNEAKLVRVSYLRQGMSGPNLVSMRINPSAGSQKYFIPHIFPLTLEFKYTGNGNSGGCSSGAGCNGYYQQVITEGFGGLTLLNVQKIGPVIGTEPSEIFTSTPFIFNTY